MKTRVMFLLTAVIAASVFAPAGFAQRGGGGGGGRAGGGGGGGRGGGGGGGGRPAAISRPAGGFQQRAITNPQNSPSTNIQPMRNPVAPFFNYNQTPRPPVANATSRGLVDGGRFDGGRDRGRFNNDIVVVGGGGYYPGYPGYYGGYGGYGYGLDPFYGPVLNPAPIPGQVPYTYGLPLWNPPTVPGQLPNTIPYPSDSPTALVPPVEAPPIVASDPIYYPEQRTIVPTEPLVPIKELPEMGSTRAAVEAKYGEPWGVVTLSGKEKVYFRGMMVVFEQGQVVEVQRR